VEHLLHGLVVEDEGLLVISVVISVFLVVLCSTVRFFLYNAMVLFAKKKSLNVQMV
jgi:hypothetical protein